MKNDTLKKSATLPEKLGVRDDMITCIGCGQLREIEVNPTLKELSALKRIGDVLRGSLYCPRCEHWTAFQMTNGHLTFIQSDKTFGVLAPTVGSVLRGIYEEAEASFYATAYRGSAILCRACVEDELVVQGFKQGRLEQKINAAKRSGALDSTLVTLAHGARLVGNKAVHTQKSISPNEIPPLLSATVQLVNHLALWKPPVAQSTKGSSAT